MRTPERKITIPETATKMARIATPIGNDGVMGVGSHLGGRWLTTAEEVEAALPRWGPCDTAPEAIVGANPSLREWTRPRGDVGFVRGGVRSGAPRPRAPSR